MAEPSTPAPSRADVRARLIALIHEITNAAPDDLTDDVTIDDLKMDSVTFVELQVAIEDEWGIEVDAIEVVERNALGPIVEYVHERVRERAA